MLKILLMSLLCFSAIACGDSNAFHYDYNGILSAADGKPAAGVKVFVDDWEGSHLYATDESRWDHWRYWGTTTDREGRFAGTFNTSEAYYKWLGLCPINPPAKPLEGVYLIVNRQEGWTTIYVPLDARAQKHGYEGGRRLDLPLAVLKQSSTE